MLICLMKQKNIENSEKEGGGDRITADNAEQISNSLPDEFRRNNKNLDNIQNYANQFNGNNRSPQSRMNRNFNK